MLMDVANVWVVCSSAPNIWLHFFFLIHFPLQLQLKLKITISPPAVLSAKQSIIELTNF